MLYLTEEDVRQCCSWDEAIDAVEEVFSLQGQGRVALPPRWTIPLEGIHGFFRAMGACAFDQHVAGVKVAVRHWGREPCVYMLLFDVAESALLAVMEADGIGLLRTGAASAVAVRHLAPPSARRLGLIGAGHHAAAQLRAISRVRPLEEVRVFSPSSRRVEFATSMSGELGLRVLPAESPEQAVAGTEIVVTVSRAAQPVMERRWLSAPALICAVGSNRSGEREVDSDTVCESQVIVDDREQALLEAGDLLIPMREGRITERHILAEMGEVVCGRAPALDREGIILFKSCGIASEDLAVARVAYQAAMRRGLGKTI